MCIYIYIYLYLCMHTISMSIYIVRHGSPWFAMVGHGSPWFATASGYRSEEEKIDFANARKDVGARLFKEGRYSMAVERYKKIVDLFNYVDSYKVQGHHGAYVKTRKDPCNKHIQINKYT